MYISNQIKDPKPSETLPTAYMSHGTSLQINLENYHSQFFFYSKLYKLFFFEMELHFTRKHYQFSTSQFHIYFNVLLAVCNEWNYESNLLAISD